MRRHKPAAQSRFEFAAAHEFEIGIFLGTGEKFLLRGGENVPDVNGFAVGKQAIDEVVADETCRAGDENLFH